MRNIVVIAHNLRSCHNIGSLLRTAEGLGITEVFLTGYTPYPSQPNDNRMPHIAAKIDRQINKTALGAEKSVRWRHCDTAEDAIIELQRLGYAVAAIEQDPTSQPLQKFMPPEKIALLVGREVEGIESEILQLTDLILEVPMFGTKESFNVVQAAAMAMYHCRFTS